MITFLYRPLLMVVFLASLLFPGLRPAQARTLQADPVGFVVNNASDNVDTNIGDGICSTGLGCSLRAALQEAAYWDESRQMISFSFSERTTIPLLSPLPALSDGDDIFGEGRVTIDGSLLNEDSTAIGIRISGEEASVVRGLRIQNFYWAGIYVIGSNKLIGGPDANARNIIINNGKGIDFSTFAFNNTIRGNYIGINTDGVTAAPNGIGININALGSYDIGNITIGGDVPGERNIISGNSMYGIKIDALPANYVHITGNYIGTNAAGTAAVPNLRQGIHITNSQATMEIGGDLPGEGNLIAGNGYDGILIDNGWYFKLLGNIMSASFDGSAYLPNQYNDVYIKKAYYFDIGGDSAEKGNVLLNGVKIEGSSTTYCEEALIQNNWIGVAPGGAARTAATGSGLLLIYATKTRTIANRISNFDRGITMLIGSNNGFSLNRIYNNRTLGIDLGSDGVTLNDKGDADAGPNGLQNFPRITSAEIVPLDLLQYLKISVTLNTIPNIPVRIELFSSPSCHPSGYGEGYDPLRNTTLTSDDAGNITWVVPDILYWPRSEYIGPCLSATATAVTASDTVHNTSEFSAGVFIGQKTFLPVVLR